MESTNKEGEINCMTVRSEFDINDKWRDKKMESRREESEFGSLYDWACLELSLDSWKKYSKRKEVGMIFLIKVRKEEWRVVEES